MGMEVEMDDREKIPSYKEFVAQYGNRPKDIIYDMAVKLAEDFYRKPRLSDEELETINTSAKLQKKAEELAFGKAQLDQRGE